jgi:hypothetical protein
MLLKFFKALCPHTLLISLGNHTILSQLSGRSSCNRMVSPTSENNEQLVKLEF